MFTKSLEVVDHGDPSDHKFQNVLFVLDILLPFLLDECRQEADQASTLVLPMKVL